MILFFVGVIEMAIVAAWTRYVSEAKIIATGIVSSINIFIWFYVLQQVVDHIDNWVTIIPYAAGCAVGSMIGACDRKSVRRTVKKVRKLLNRIPAAKAKNRPKTKAIRPERSWGNVYEHLG
ncbi:hypothetical protein JW899_02445 [Candidatus Uhrbacteria bacterium]|nr:hypothetical protein [Candidatus Uhrbacteria bacterium]